MKKRISQKEWEYIGKYNPAAKWVRPFCSYSLVEIEDGFRRECKISWPVYLAIFIPVHLLQALYCIWDGGLKEFEIAKRDLGQDVYHENYGWNKLDYSKVKEVWEKHK
jgi:hypothetical protein